MEDLKGRVVLVTGGGRGLGEAVCQTLSSAGASVIVADIRQELAEKVAGEIQAGGKEAMALPLDVTNEEQAEAFVQKVAAHALHVEARPHNIQVTALIAGGMQTPFLLDRFPDIDVSTLQDPKNVAETIRFLLLTPAGTVIPEMMVLPMREGSWP